MRGRPSPPQGLRGDLRRARPRGERSHPRPPSLQGADVRQEERKDWDDTIEDPNLYVIWRQPFDVLFTLGAGVKKGGNGVPERIRTSPLWIRTPKRSCIRRTIPYPSFGTPRHQVEFGNTFWDEVWHGPYITWNRTRGYVARLRGTKRPTLGMRSLACRGKIFLDK